LLTFKTYFMCKFSNFLGIDVSKDFFDAVVILNSQPLKTQI
jgi:hypothetical protein